MGQEKTVPEYEAQSPTVDANGAEPMTGAQASHLKTLAEEVREPGAFEQGLSRREASRRIDVLIDRIRINELPPHTD